MVYSYFAIFYIRFDLYFRICLYRWVNNMNDLEKIKEGDILFVRNYGLLGWLIRKVTHSNWNHCCLYIGKGHLLDTDFWGLRYRAIMAYKDIPHKICRVKKTPKKQIKEVCQHARKINNSKYSIRRLFRFDDTKENYTCSQAVNECYMIAGIVLSRKGAMCTPSDIERNKRVVRRK